ncbi:MAG TPA: DUF4405 domain-containing protein [Aggregatilineaceae bacterium]|nr:DUF4405 domain-containing protein [Aggregatilineaceae bacterium]
MLKFNKNKIKFYLDVVLITAYVVLMEPQFTGESWHEWVGLAIGGAVLIHLALNWKWIATVTRRFFGHVARQARINYLLNLLLLVSFTLTVVSGILISKNLSTAQALNMSMDASRNWREIHVWIPDVTLLIVGIHLALHWKWIVYTSKRRLFKMSRRTQPGLSKETAS